MSRKIPVPEDLPQSYIDKLEAIEKALDAKKFEQLDTYAEMLDAIPYYEREEAKRERQRKRRIKQLFIYLFVILLLIVLLGGSILMKGLF